MRAKTAYVYIRESKQGKMAPLALCENTPSLMSEATGSKPRPL